MRTGLMVFLVERDRAMRRIEALCEGADNGIMMMQKGTNVNLGEDGPDWDGAYVEGAMPWDKGAPAPPLAGYLARHEVKGRVLVPGCGLGHDVRALAAQGAEVVGLDISPTAVGMAGEQERAGEETYLLGDLFALGDEMKGAFDWVFEHTCFCAIDPSMRADYVEAVSGVLKPGGKLLGVFYLNPYDEEHEPGAGPPHGATVEEIERLFGGRFEVVEGWVPGEAYEGREGLEWMGVMERRGEG
jgi:SAM-dependent methyltransferase